MPQFADHIKQARHNLNFLAQINSGKYECIDWQVTTCFYVALHLVNAHLAKHNMQYRSHNKVKEALNPAIDLSFTKLPEDEYVAYVSLQNLSRRSRYLVNDKDINSDKVSITYEKHLAKAIRHLDRLLSYFSENYNLSIEKIQMRCSAIKIRQEIKCIEVVS